MQEQLIAYLAGFFDGEGCVMIQRSGQSKAGHRRYRLTACVTQVDPRPITLFANSFPGSYRSKWLSASKRTQYEWGVNGLNAYEFLKVVLPELVVKREQAEICIAWYDLPWRSQRRTPGGAWKTRTDEQARIDEEFFLKVKALKHAS